MMDIIILLIRIDINIILLVFRGIVKWCLLFVIERNKIKIF